MARECATKGKGKGDSKGGKGDSKGFGKGYGGKGDTKGSSKGAKGIRKEYQDTCWRCGKVGHKALECRVQQANAVDEEVGEDIDVGGVWMIAAVNERRSAEESK